MPTVREEWRAYWYLPLVAAVANIATVIHIYTLGPFMAPLEAEFGWSRAQISSAITVSNGLNAGLGVVVGFLIDKYGPRRIGLIGICVMAAAFASVSTATGSYGNWIFLWFLISLGAAWTQPTIWTSAVSSRFDAGRGFAIAVTICGTSVGATMLPIIATEAILNFGWRWAYIAIGAGYFLLAMPLNFLFFRGAADSQARLPREDTPAPPRTLSGMEAREAFRSLTFYRLSMAGLLFAFCAMASIVHFIPILTDRGIGAVEAASIAGLIGVASLIGRFLTGYLLDRFPPERVALVAFALPVFAALLLLFGDGPLAYSLAAIVIGASLGGEYDIIIYLTTRHFGLKRFGAIFATVLVFLTAATATGPLTAGAIYDHFGSYQYYLWLTIPMVLCSALLAGTLPRAPEEYNRGAGH
ncbi:MAG: MFS transporter [Novosphingobium sp.]|nr:MFS transporter [Novosphingobium sp.]